MGRIVFQRTCYHDILLLVCCSVNFSLCLPSYDWYDMTFCDKAAVTSRSGCVVTQGVSLMVQRQCDQIGQFFCTLGNHSKLVATIILSKSPTLVGNFCKGVKIIHFPIEIIFDNFYRHLAIFHLVTLSLGVSRDKISQVLVFRLQFVKSIHSVTTFYRARIPTYTNVDHVVLFSVRCAAFFVRFFGIKRWQFYNTTST